MAIFHHVHRRCSKLQKPCPSVRYRLNCSRSQTVDASRFSSFLSQELFSCCAASWAWHFKPGESVTSCNEAVGPQKLKARVAIIRKHDSLSSLYKWVPQHNKYITSDHFCWQSVPGISCWIWARLDVKPVFGAEWHFSWGKLETDGSKASGWTWL